MGSFDRVSCEYPLSDPERDWQTKSRECQMTDYRITLDGALRRKPIGGEWSDCNLTGEIRFYDGDDAFSAYFVDGKLKELHRIPWSEA